MRIAGRIPTFAAIDLTRSDVDDESFAFLKPLRDVQDIRVQGRPLTNSSMLIVRRWNGLRSASFHGTEIDDAGVAHLAGCEQLTELSLRSTRLTDRSVETLVSLKQLERLDVTNCRLSRKAIKQLTEALPKCKVETRDPWHVEAE
ncbi:hypothetical protein [Novipirellula maiorica]|uniref:hypothetical protein n=1 Tax=Novipirellula maiorica TaxID=1265734 RepID=UPI001181A997|nr:hypothetical protein [Rhodopirellula maiorica]